MINVLHFLNSQDIESQFEMSLTIIEDIAK